MQQIVPNLWFDRRAEEAVDFYTSVFPDASIEATSHYPTEDLPGFQQDFAGQVLAIDFTLAGQRFTAINADSHFAPAPATSFFVNFDPSRDPEARTHLDKLWEALSEGGQVLMPLESYPHSAHYGWIQDRYGISWQLMLTDPAGEPRPMIIPCLLFGNVVQNLARLAIEYYADTFPDARIRSLVPYVEATGAAAAGSLMFGDVRLTGTWIAAMDSAAAQDFTFTEAISLAVPCDDQAEIDLLWEKLSYVPEAEACGWCKDQFGLSWQIVPADMDRLLQRPGAYQKLLGMKRIVIDEL